MNTHSSKLLQRTAHFFKLELRVLLGFGNSSAFSTLVMRKSSAVIHSLVHDIMLKALSDCSAPRRNLLTLAMDSSGTKGVAEVRDFVMNFFLASNDTTTFTMSWFLVMINRHPRVLSKIRDEIRSNLPNLQERVPTFNELHKLPYLEASIKESLRLNMPALHRTSNRDITLSDGTYVPCCAHIIISAYASARMTGVWGSDAAEFRPERFIDETTGTLKVVSPFKFLGFIGGPRQCLGMRFALLEMKTVMAAMLGRFDVQTAEDPHELTYAFSLLLPVKGELMASVRPVGDA